MSLLDRLREALAAEQNEPELPAVKVTEQTRRRQKVNAPNPSWGDAVPKGYDKSTISSSQFHDHSPSNMDGELVPFSETLKRESQAHKNFNIFKDM